MNARITLLRYGVACSMVCMGISACNFQLVQEVEPGKESIVEKNAVSEQTEPFRVIKTEPADGAVNWDIQESFSVFVNKAVRPQTIVRDNVRISVTDSDLNEAPFALAVITYDPTLRKIIIDPGVLAVQKQLSGETVSITLLSGIATTYGEHLEQFTYTLQIQ